VPLAFTDFVTTAGSGVENRLVQRFLSIADRTTRNPAPNEGELSWLLDLNVYQYYDGATWQNLSKGYVADATRTASVSPITTTEIITDQLTFTAVAGVRYKLTFNSSMQSTNTADIGSYRLRWQAGGVLTNAGTQFDIDAMTFPITNKMLICRVATVTGITAGTASIGVGMIRASGAGTITAGASATQLSTLILEIV
jgi:hypothetical protein